MGRHALGRGGLTAAVSSLAVAVAAASVVVLTEGGDQARAATTAAPATTQITLTDPSSTVPRTDRPHVTGADGFLHQQSGMPGLLWTDHSDGTTVTVRNGDGSVYAPDESCADFDPDCRAAWYGSDSDLVALPTGTSATSVVLWDPATGKRTKVNLSQPYNMLPSYYRALAGRTIVTTHTLADIVDGSLRERRISGESVNIGYDEVVAADSAGVLWQESDEVKYVDLATAESTTVFTDTSTSYDRPVMNADRVGWYRPGSGELHWKPRTDLAAEEQVVSLMPTADLAGDPVLVGDRLLLPLTTSTEYDKLVAVSLTDGSTQTLLARAGQYATPARDGAAFVTGGTGADDWWVQRVTQAADGTLKLEKVYQVPAKENAKTGLALNRGSLRVAEKNPASASSDTTSVRTLSTDGSGQLTASAATASNTLSSAVCPYAGADCSALWSNTGWELPGADVYLRTTNSETEQKTDLLLALGEHTLDFDAPGGGAIVDVSDGYVVYNSGGTTPAQFVGEFGQGQKLKRTVRAAALNGSTLWSATTTAGKLTSYSLATDETLATVTVPGLGCVPSELQAAGRWVYWACGTASAGVYDTKAGTSAAVTPGDVLLGDGFTVRHDHDADTLVLTEAAGGATRVIASGLPDSGLAVDRRYRWAVDEYTGLVAWTDEYERVRVATTGVTPSAPTVFENEAGRYADPSYSEPWWGTWLSSRPVTSWSLTFTSTQSGATGKATRTITGGASPAWLSASWNGKTASGGYFPNGRFTWSLKATALGTSTVSTLATGEGYLDHGAAVRHDYASIDGPDGRGDLLTLNSTGGLTYQHGTGTGKFGEKTTGTGWPTTARFIPVGDLSGDRCNDVLVRYSNGGLRLYKPGCNAALKPTTSYSTLATSGWTQYDLLTAPGDVSGDGRPDLVVRTASTGTVYLYKGTSTGTLSARVKLYDNWKGYKKVIAAGDLDGDGIGDLLAQDTANTLYRYKGKGDGTFATRVKLFANWGSSYNAVVGVGDITDDGRADLVSRDTSGTVWRNSGDGKGSFGGRVKIATGWSGYKALS
ncbi:FG-GAP repeat domain-containing protein [Streptomyces sp. NPDC001595]|uniref:FG-GAP repeat domain-containing protein n=1 Tax=Streptomyces sp. NPDC001532 TaxID=3154520 RepID=UPI003317F08A